MNRLTFVVQVAALSAAAYLMLRALLGFRLRSRASAACALLTVGALLATPLGAPAVTTAWLVASALVVVAAVPWLAVRGAIALVRRLRARAADAPADPSRRRLLAGVVPAAAAVVAAGGTVVATRRFEVREEEVRVRGLPRALDGFRIGQITDVHVGAFVDPEDLGRAVAALNAAGVDLQVMTGDLIDDMRQLAPTFAALEACTARHGMLAILGNHEKARGLDAVLAAYAEAAPRGRVRLLVDEATTLEHGGARLRVVGVDYPMRRGGRHRMPRAQRRAFMEASAARAFAGDGGDDATTTTTTLCLSHHPDFFPLAAARGAKLTLAGHTHGGQVGFFRAPLVAPFEYMLGRYRRGDAHLYVSAGTGHWFPFRVGIPTEVTVLTLRAA